MNWAAILLGSLHAGITFLLAAQASGAAGIEVIAPIGWLGIGCFGAMLSFALARLDPKK